jgi:hypothetical protein
MLRAPFAGLTKALDTVSCCGVLLSGDAVRGGFYMGADYVKYTTPMATSLSLLAWSMVEFKGGFKEQVCTITCHGGLRLCALACAVAALPDHPCVLILPGNSGHVLLSSLLSSLFESRRQRVWISLSKRVRKLLLLPGKLRCCVQSWDTSHPWFVLLPLQAAVYDQAVDVLAHGVKYLIKCHNTVSGTFVVQIGEPSDYVVDVDRATGFWGLPENMPANRSAHRCAHMATCVVTLFIQLQTYFLYTGCMYRSSNM